ncbi:MAG: AmmeMemoRadiSam system radical SAM enzyme [Dehalococcoidia bacterium]|nr:AmmeMemoRadiSam system radical SAM enzyme [Dehalococcoidia bacterium]
MAEDRIREALLYKHLTDKVQCLTCERRCLIPEGESGLCATRKAIGGRLYTLEYGDISSISANPIEKKPFFHFYPGTKALTVGSWSCNFTCPWCQNYDISKSPQNIGKGEYISPARLIELVRRYRCQGTSVSFNEPTLLFEYSLDIFALAREEGYYNTYVTNGYMTAEALEMLVAGGLNAMNVDIKGEAKAVKRFCGADVDLVWRNVVRAKECGVWVELTTLIMPGVNDAKEGLSRIARRIKAELGDDIPWHLTAYYPAYKFRSESYVSPTPVGTLEKARDMAVAEGLKFVYIGNVPGHPYENTYCPGCKQSLIERYGFAVTRYNISPDKHCPYCGEEIPVIGEPDVPNHEYEGKPKG